MNESTRAVGQGETGGRERLGNGKARVADVGAQAVTGGHKITRALTLRVLGSRGERCRRRECLENEGLGNGKFGGQSETPVFVADRRQPGRRRDCGQSERNNVQPLSAKYCVCPIRRALVSPLRSTGGAVSYGAICCGPPENCQATKIVFCGNFGIRRFLIPQSHRTNVFSNILIMGPRMVVRLTLRQNHPEYGYLITTVCRHQRAKHGPVLARNFWAIHQVL